MTLLLLALSLAQAPGPSLLDGIAQEAGKLPHDTVVQRVEALVAAQPTAPEAGRALLFLGQFEQRSGLDAQARRAWERVEHDYPATPWAGDATLALADLDVAARRYAPALARYDRLAAEGTGRWQYQARVSAARTRGERDRWWSVLAITAVLLGLCGWRLVPVWRARTLWPPPEEVSMGAPVAVMMLLASLTQPEREALAVRLLAGGALVLLWANGAASALHPPAGLRRAAWAAVGVAQAAAWLYCSVVLGGLWEKLVETWVTGAEQ